PTARLPAEQAGEVSVLRTGMIPVPGLPDEDFSALGFIRNRNLTFPVNARCGAPVLRVCPATNVPFKDVPEGCAAESFSDEQAEGFRAMWEWVAGNRTLLLDQLEQARGLEVRYVVRDTHAYYLALVRAMFEGTPAVAALPALGGERAAFVPLLAEELNALAQLDLPHFTLRADARSLDPAGLIFASSGYEAAKGLLENMSEEDLERQLRHLGSAWQLYAATRRLLCPLQG
ncbi:DUF4135 domain-containing protein, partial [Silvibacterium sp.]|uniref:DUF4135 domain-containing protein n=1 Tax=Silvibacterium sp. TaxID=1964179 RepID=UPI0039E69A56